MFQPAVFAVADTFPAVTVSVFPPDFSVDPRIIKPIFRKPLTLRFQFLQLLLSGTAEPHEEGIFPPFMPKVSPESYHPVTSFQA